MEIAGTGFATAIYLSLRPCFAPEVTQLHAINDGPHPSDRSKSRRAQWERFGVAVLSGGFRCGDSSSPRGGELLDDDLDAGRDRDADNRADDPKERSER